MSVTDRVVDENDWTIDNALTQMRSSTTEEVRSWATIIETILLDDRDAQAAKIAALVEALAAWTLGCTCECDSCNAFFAAVRAALAVGEGDHK